jgi:hypothetical protein
MQPDESSTRPGFQVLPYFVKAIVLWGVSAPFPDNFNRAEKGEKLFFRTVKATDNHQKDNSHRYQHHRQR